MTDHRQPFWTFILTTLTLAALASSIEKELENTGTKNWYWTIKRPSEVLGVRLSGYRLFDDL